MDSDPLIYVLAIIGFSVKIIDILIDLGKIDRINYPLWIYSLNMRTILSTLNLCCDHNYIM